MKPIEISGIGKYGVIKDLPPHLLPPEAWSDCKNVQFDKSGVRRIGGHGAVFSPASVSPVFIQPIPGQLNVFWIYTSLNKAYVYESGVHTNITRQVAAVDVDYTTSAPNSWDATVLAGVPILNNGVDVPQFWPALLPATKLSNLTNWPANVRAKTVKAFGSYLVALNITEAGIAKPHMIWWSHKTSPGTIPSSWDYANPALDAGRTELTDIEGGELVDALLLGDKLILYKNSSTHALRFIGGNDIFSPDLLLTTSGILGTKCAVDFMSGTQHFVVTEDDIITHAGTKAANSVIDDRNRKFVFSNLDVTNKQNSFTFHNSRDKQCWFCFPESGATSPSIAAIWNYKDDNWTFRDFKGVAAKTGSIIDVSPETWSTVAGTWDDTSEVWGKLQGRSNVFVTQDSPHFYILNESPKFGETDAYAYVTRTGIAIDGKDRQGNITADITSHKLFKRLWPKIVGTDSITVRVGIQDSYTDAVQWISTQFFNPLVDKYLDITVAGKLLALSFESTNSSLWELQGYDLEVVKLAGL